MNQRRKPPAERAAQAAMGLSLQVLQRLAGSELVQKYGLDRPLQSVLKKGTEAGFRAVSRFAASQKKPLAEPVRLENPPPPRKGLFDLTLSEEQEMQRDMVRKFAADLLRPAAEAADTEAKTPAELLSKFAELGFTLMAIPEELGGMGFERAPASAALLIEDLAYGDVGLAYAALSPLSVVNALTAWGSAEQQARYLTPFTEEHPPLAALAHQEPGVPGERLGTRALARPEGDYVLTGTKVFVPLAETADFFLVTAELVGGAIGLFIVERDLPGLTIVHEGSMGLRSAGLGRLTFEGVELPLGARLEAYDHQDFLRRGRVAWAAMAVGGCQAVLDYVVPYINERKAFGEPISNRQSVAFLAADIAIETEGMRLVTWRAASRLEQGKDAARECALAKNFAGKHAMKIGTDGVQLLGGHGFVKDHPVERWYRDLRAIALLEGGLLV